MYYIDEGKQFEFNKKNELKFIILRVYRRDIPIMCIGFKNEKYQKRK